jgi:feruloyl esterase
MFVSLAGCVPHQPPTRAQDACEALRSLTWPGAQVTAAERVAPGALAVASADVAEGTHPAVNAALAKLPSFCRVKVAAKPGPGSDIRLEVWLPAAGWNGRLQAVGDGGLAGYIPFGLMAPALEGGYATAGTDTGHVGANVDFMPGNPDKHLDFAYRSTHELAKAAKAVIAAHYGRPAQWAYYNACSGGGRHGLTSAQRYPEDFDGIVSGAPSWNQARLDAGRIGVNLMVNRTPAHQIPASKYAMVHRAVLQACDGLDGVADGVLENPRACAFDYASLQCKGADEPNCLTAAQVESARVLTTPFRDAASGRVLMATHLRPGSELQWGTLASPQPLANSVARVRRLHLKDVNHEFRLENVAEDVERAARMDQGLFASDRFDLRPYFSRGGKLLMWHGWSDPQVPAEGSLIYREGVRQAAGAAADESLALFMLPGVLHCRGGPGADTFDAMAAMTAWVEQGRKPQRIVAERLVDGRVVATRALCPYPQVARYGGSGATNDAAQFACTGQGAAASGPGR